MIERKAVPPTQPSPIEPSLPSARTSRSIPHSPDDIRGIPSPVSPTPQQQQPQEYHDAPEVVPGTAPEHVPDHARGDYAGEKLTLGPDTNPSSGPQAVYDDSTASQAQTVVGSSPVHGSVNSDPKSAPQALNPTLLGGEGEGEEVKAEKRPWWKRKIILLIIFFAILLVIGLGIGLGLGLTHNNGGGGDNQGSPEGDDDTSISCDGGLCPAVLSTTIHDGQLNVFARTSSHDIAVRTHDGERWSSGWVNLGSTPDGSNIVSQPVSVSWVLDGEETPRLDMFVVSSAGRSGNRVYGRHKNGTDGRWSDWTDLGAGAGSSVEVCRTRNDSIYLWTVDEESRNITQNYWVPTSNAEAKRKRQNTPPNDEEEEDENEPDEDEPDEDEPDEDGNTTPPPPPNNNNPDPDNSTTPGNWASTADEPWNPAADPAQGPAASAPGIACRSSSISHDLIWYDANTNLAWHQSYNDTSSSWSDRRSFEGNWVGNPSIFSYTSLSSSSTEEDEPQRFDFFGVQDNKQVYTFSWSSASDYSRMTTLNGSIISTPTSIALSSSTRDIFALGSNGNLHHQHYDGTGWQSEWEDLDIEAWSASSAVVSDDGDAWLFWLGEGGSLMVGRMENGEGSSGGGAKWADQLVVEDLGGDLTLEYFIMEE